MRDQGLQEAIRAVGGVTQLARRLGIAQPSVSNWEQIPVERVASIENVTGIHRSVLRPDLFAVETSSEISDVNAARAQEYALLATLLARAPDGDLISRLAELRGDVSPLGVAHAALSQVASETTVIQVEREYFDLFIGLGRGELLPYGSYYLTGFLHERPLSRLRGDLAMLGIERAEGKSEPEDHAAIICEIMSGIVSGRFWSPPGADQRVFEKHVAPWLGRFFVDLEHAQTGSFYRRVGALGRVFVEIETEAFALPT